MLFLPLIAEAEEKSPPLPPESLKAPWLDLQKLNFKDWRIKSLGYIGKAGDGGSIGFSCVIKDDESFMIIATNPAYWTSEDKKLKRQVYYVVYKNLHYRVDPKSKDETNLIAILEKSKLNEQDRKLTNNLIERIKSRKPLR